MTHRQQPQHQEDSHLTIITTAVEIAGAAVDRLLAERDHDKVTANHIDGAMIVYQALCDWETKAKKEGQGDLSELRMPRVDVE